jgi:hypothetical protein
MNYPTQTDNAAKATTYNGWANYETWNVALYIDNDYESYQIALTCKDFSEYRDRFIDQFETGYTMDDVSLFDEKLSIEELDNKIKELQD